MDRMRNGMPAEVMGAVAWRRGRRTDIADLVGRFPAAQGHR
jgi:hypothetical protein